MKLQFRTMPTYFKIKSETSITFVCLKYTGWISFLDDSAGNETDMNTALSLNHQTCDSALPFTIKLGDRLQSLVLRKTKSWENLGISL